MPGATSAKKTSAAAASPKTLPLAMIVSTLSLRRRPEIRSRNARRADSPWSSALRRTHAPRTRHTRSLRNSWQTGASTGSHVAVKPARPNGRAGIFRSDTLCRQIAQHILQDPAVPEVVEFVQRIDAADHRHVLHGPVAERDPGIHLLARLDAVQTIDRDRLVALQLERSPGSAFLEDKGDDTHAHQIRAMDALEGLRNNGADAKQFGPLGRPVARRAIAVFNPGEDHQRHAFLTVLHGGVIDRHFLFRGIVDRIAPFAAVLAKHVISDADVGEGAAHHDLMIAAAGAVLVEVRHADAVIDEVFARRRGGLDGARRRNVVG